MNILPRIANRLSCEFEKIKRVIQVHYMARAYRKDWSSIEKVVLFIGYPYSGHSLVGSIIDSHQNAIISHELDILKHVSQPSSILFSEIVYNSRKKHSLGRIQSGYSYDIPGLWQGRYENLRVIGDKKGGLTTYYIRENPNLLVNLKHTFSQPIYFIHVTRNPFDNISTWSERQNLPLDEAIKHYAKTVRTVEKFRQTWEQEHIIDIKHEDIILQSEISLINIFNFLDLPIDNIFIESCLKILYDKPNKSRNNVEWNQHKIKEVGKLIEKFSFLKDYKYI